MEPLLLPLKVAAASIGVSLSTARGLVRTGKLPVKRIGSRMYITVDDLKAYVNAL
jgi:excisionase family DNA binding protein